MVRLFAISLCLLLSACGVPGATNPSHCQLLFSGLTTKMKIGNIKVNESTKDQMIQALGQPDQTKSAGGMTTYSYELHEYTLPGGSCGSFQFTVDDSSNVIQGVDYVSAF